MVCCGVDFNVGIVYNLIRGDGSVVADTEVVIMKKIIIFVFVFGCILSLAGCKQLNRTEPVQDNQQSTQTENKLEEEKIFISLPDFSFAQERQLYVEGMPGVKTSGFVNVSEVEVDDINVAKVAKNECTIESTSCGTYLDTAERMWKVVFFNTDADGCDQTVYLGYDGKTVLIVYGQ